MSAARNVLLEGSLQTIAKSYFLPLFIRVMLCHWKRNFFRGRFSKIDGSMPLKPYFLVMYVE